MTNLPRFIVLRVSRLVLADSRANGASVIVRYYRGRVLQHGPGQRARDHRLQLVAAEDARRRRPANAPKISLSATELRVQPPPTHVLNPGRRRPDAKTCARRSQTRKRPGLYLLPHRPPVDPEVVRRSTSATQWSDTPLRPCWGSASSASRQVTLATELERDKRLSRRARHRS